ncbi:MAG: CoA transferase [Kiloniellales bacterium]
MSAETAEAIKDLWQGLGAAPEALARLQLSGEEPLLPSSFKVGLAAQACLGAAALMASELLRLRSGRAAEVSVSMRHALAEFRSERYLTVDGASPADLFDKIAGAYRCGDGRWVRLHTNFPHHRSGMLDLLGCDYAREAVAEALLAWEGEAFEAAAVERGLCMGLMRSFEEWDAHPQAAALRALPLVQIERIGGAPPEPLPPAERPLAGVKVLDLTRVIAGPVAGRCLAAHGAEVLRVAGAHLPFMPPLVIDSGRGKRSCHLDLREAEGAEALDRLLEDADVFVQSYRPGALAAKGFGPEAVAAKRPGIVHASLSAYGEVGPWASRRGFDSLVQTATGFNRAEAEAAGEETPKALPCQVLDHGSGYLLALGIMVALARRAEEGGSWSVRVSLARSGHWLRSLGRQNALDTADMPREALSDLLEESQSPFGRISAISHAGRIEGAPPAWQLPPVPLGSHPARWRSA